MAAERAMAMLAEEGSREEDATGASAPPDVRASALCKQMDERRVLDRIDLEIESGGCVALLGTNGAGKSTLLRVIATLSPATSGKLELFGRAVGRDSADLRARIGMVGHQLMLYRELSALENLEFFGRLYAVAPVRERAMELLEFVGLADRAGDAIKTLSRGMAQRVAIARAFMHSPRLLLTDEPFTGLDVHSIDRLERCLEDLSAEGKTILITTHDIDQGLRLARRVVVVRRGRIVLDEAADRLDRGLVAAAMGGGP